jgi:23S rRNA (uracil1939-C5)-methyltransferase
MNEAPPPPRAAGTLRARVERLGSRGEGVVEGPRGPIYAAYALPGELIDVQGEGDRAALVEVIDPSPDRVPAICPFFGICGGCAVQTLATGPYAEWKRGLVATALAQAGLSAEVAPLVDAHGEGRRRVTIHARARGNWARENLTGGTTARETTARETRAQGTGAAARVVAGFTRARSHEIVDLPGCPILAPGLAGAFEAARAIGRLLAALDKPLDVQATQTENGLDVDVRGAGPLPDDLRRDMTALADALDLARLSHHGLTLAERRPPTLLMGRARVAPPGGGFLQATALGEETLAALAREAVGSAKRVADLFSGCGAFALRLAETAEVLALDSDAAAIAALDRGKRIVGLRRVEATARDLFRRPLSAAELRPFEAVVFDPPRAGAAAQASEIAQSEVPTVVAVSCHPGSFARDAAILTAGGYRLQRVTPVDQFRYSAHVELVGVFAKPKPKAKKRGLLSR